jgi:hypothetical protein
MSSPIVLGHGKGALFSFFFESKISDFVESTYRYCWFADFDRQNYGLLVSGTNSSEEANCELRYLKVSLRTARSLTETYRFNFPEGFPG